MRFADGVGKVPDGRPVAADNRAILRSLANLFQRYPNTYLLLSGFTAGKGDDNEEDRRVYTLVKSHPFVATSVAYANDAVASDRKQWPASRKRQLC
jgi:hypothetical protein